MDAPSLPKPGRGLVFEGSTLLQTPEVLGRATTQASWSYVGGGKLCLGAQGYCLGAGGGDSPPACASMTSLILLERLLIYA